MKHAKNKDMVCPWDTAIPIGAVTEINKEGHQILETNYT